MYPDAYIEFLVHFHGDRDYFECHEILEEYWKETAKEGKQSIWVGCILLAVSNYHYRRNNLTGASRTLAKAVVIFQNSNKTTQECLGLDMEALLPLLAQRLEHIQSNQAYTSFNLPIIDKTLWLKCQETSIARGLIWGKESDLANTELIHRHSLRDRSTVLRERQQAISKKNKN
jgi:uncharacterized protein